MTAIAAAILMSTFLTEGGLHVCRGIGQGSWPSSMLTFNLQGHTGVARPRR